MDAINALNREITILNKKIDHKTVLSKNAEKLAQASLSKGDRESAKRYLQKKSQIDTNIQELYTMLSNLESQILAIEGATINRQVMDATLIATNVMKSTNITQEDAENAIEECREQIDNVNNITSIINQPIVDLPDVDEALLRLEAPIFPAVPTAALVASKLPQAVDDLEAMMA
jgi:phage shock protein A